MADIHNFFRSLFGLDIGGRSPHDRIGLETEDGENDGLNIPGGHSDSDEEFFDNMFSYMMRDLERRSKEIERMFQNIKIDFPQDIQIHGEHPGVSQLPANPRDDMLKQPDSVPTEQEHPYQGHRGMIQPPHFFGGFFPRNLPSVKGPSEVRDRELDGVKDKDEIAGLFQPNSPETHQHPKSMVPHFGSFSSGSSVSVSTSRGPNGQIEERKTVRDSSGREEVTVTRRLGGKSHSVTTTTDRNGLQEKHENFTNMDEKDLPEFNNSWRSNSIMPRFSEPGRPDSMLKSPQQPYNSDKDTLFSSFVKSMFDWIKPKD